MRYYLKGQRFTWDAEKVLEMDGGDGYATK